MQRVVLAAGMLVVAAFLAGAAAAADCTATSTGLVPLPDLGTGKYKGLQGGLYPGGQNTVPSAYAQAGLAAAGRVTRRAANGTPSSSGKIVLLSIGMSNATMEFSVFKAAAVRSGMVNPAVTIVDGAQAGMTAQIIGDPTSPWYATFWSTVASRLSAAGVTAAQVQAVWLKDTISDPAANAGTFPASAQKLWDYLRAVVLDLDKRFVNLEIVHLSSRTYAGYSRNTSTLSPEPYAYEDGFGVKALIEQRIRGQLSGPWLAWGPYLWTDGTKGRKTDSLKWTCQDVEADGVHPSMQSGRGKVAGLLADFYLNDPVTRTWFRK